MVLSPRPCPLSKQKQVALLASVQRSGRRKRHQVLLDSRNVGYPRRSVVWKTPMSLRCYQGGDREAVGQRSCSPHPL